jgi:hypothetical protein
VKDNAAVGIANEDAILHHDVHVHVQVQAPAEPLHEGDRTALAAYEPIPTPARSIEAEDRLHEEARHRAEHLRLEGRERAQLERERQDVLAHGHVGKHAVDQMRRRVRHAPACAAWACPPLLARERDKDVVTAVIAPAVDEAVSEDTTPEVRTELLLDVPRQRLGVRLARPAQEGFEVVANDAVERRLRWPARCVGGREGRHRPRG